MPQNTCRQPLESTASIVLSLCLWHCATGVPLLYPVAPAACPVFAQSTRTRALILSVTCLHGVSRHALAPPLHLQNSTTKFLSSTLVWYLGGYFEATTSAQHPPDPRERSCQLQRNSTFSPPQLLSPLPKYGLARGGCLHPLRGLRLFLVGKVFPTHQENPRAGDSDPYFFYNSRTRSRAHLARGISRHLLRLQSAVRPDF